MKKYFSFICSALYACLIFYLCMMQLPEDTPPTFQIPHFDKIVHILMFFGMTGLLFVEYFNLTQNLTWGQTLGLLLKNKIADDLRPTSISNVPYYLLGTLSLLYGGIIEIIQENFVSQRLGDWLDFLADAGGVLLALLLFFVAKAHRIK